MMGIQNIKEKGLQAHVTIKLTLNDNSPQSMKNCLGVQLNQPKLWGIGSNNDKLGFSLSEGFQC